MHLASKAGGYFIASLGKNFDQWKTNDAANNDAIPVESLELLLPKIVEARGNTKLYSSDSPNAKMISPQSRITSAAA